MSAKMTSRVSPSRNGHGMPPSPAHERADLRSKLIPIDAIAPSPFNHRKHFDPDKLAQLADSMKKLGQLQAVVVRPHPKPKGAIAYELVVGERRYRAAKKAGLKQIEAKIQQLTDLEVITIQVVENDQREDVLPLERAGGYQDMIDRGVPIEEVAKKIDKSVSTVRTYLRLLRLPKVLAAALENGRVPKATCELVARIPNPELRELAAQCVLANVQNPKWLKGGRSDKGSEPLSYRETKELVEQHFMISLKVVPFDVDSMTLLPKAGSCKACPKLTGNDPEPRQGVPGNVCTDPMCFRDKLEAQRARTEADARKQGMQIVPHGERSRVFQTWGGVSPEFVDLADACYLGKANGKLYRDLFKVVLDKKEVLLVHDEHAMPHWVVRRSTADKYLKELGHLKDEPKPAASSSASRGPGPAAERRAFFELARAVGDRVAANTNYQHLDAKKWDSNKFFAKSIRALCDQGLDGISFEKDCLFAVARQRIDVPPPGPGFDESAVIDGLVKWLDHAQPAQMLGFFFECYLIDRGNIVGDDGLRHDDWADCIDRTWDELVDEAVGLLRKKKPAAH